MPKRKLSKCHPELQNIIHKVADILHLNDFNYVIIFGQDEHDSVHSQVFTVKINGLIEKQKIQHSIVIKWHENRRVRVSCRQSYVREIMFFNKIVPTYLDIQRQFQIIEGLRMKFPNCIYTCDEYERETIVTMGLLEQGYRMQNQFYKLQLDEATLALKSLATMHALSFVFERTYPEDFQEVKSVFTANVQYGNPNHETSSMRRLFETSIDVVSDPIAREKLKELSPHMLSILRKSTLPVAKYSAICHGDLWTNNVLYKYKGQRAVDVILVDLQLSRYSSPVTDIAFFMYMSAEKSLLSKHYRDLLDIYYATFAAVLRECNLKAEEIYPKNIFLEHLMEYSVFGLVEALISMMVITAPSEEALKMMEAKDHFSDAIYESHKNLFIERVNAIVDDFFSKNYSLDALLRK